MVRHIRAETILERFSHRRHPPANTGRNPGFAQDTGDVITPVSLNLDTPFLYRPPTPQAFCMSLASCSFSAWLTPTNP